MGTTVGETFNLDLNAYSSSYFYTKSGDLIPTIGNAEIKIIPEPTAIILLLAAATAMTLMTCWRTGGLRPRQGLTSEPRDDSA